MYQSIPWRLLEEPFLLWTEFHNGLSHQQGQLQNSPTSSIPLNWIPPPPGVIRANCDVAKVGNKSRAAIAVVLGDYKGRIVDGRTSIVFISPVSQGEALAIRLAGSILVDNQILENI